MGKSKGVSKRRRKNQKPKFVHRSKLKKQRIKILKKSPIINWSVFLLFILVK
jgi:hypothetical protein